MKKVLLSTLIALTSVALVLPEADARRLGGGGSFGRQSSNVGRAAPAQRSATAPAPAPAAPAAASGAAAAPIKPASPLRGLLGGALLGLGLGALMSHLGFGGALGGLLGSILMVALVGAAGLFLYRMFARKNSGPVPASANGTYSGMNRGNSFDSNVNTVANTVTNVNANRLDTDVAYGKTDTPEIGSGLRPSFGSGTSVTATAAGAANATTSAGINVGTWTLPADFDIVAFTRSAKTYFIRLQAAWDKSDLDDIREFSTTEMFAEFRLELQERGASVNVTDVVRLDAETLGVETVGNDFLASVSFTGLIKEDAAADAKPFAEVWNFSKPVNGQGGWVLAGIQQTS